MIPLLLETHPKEISLEALKGVSCGRAKLKINSWVGCLDELKSQISELSKKLKEYWLSYGDYIHQNNKYHFKLHHNYNYLKDVEVCSLYIAI